MFQSAELGHKLSKEEYDAIEPELRAELLEAQYALSRTAKFPVIILISGVRGAGKGETVNLLNEWMDPRHIHTHAFDRPSDEEQERPRMWRFWRALPPKGKTGILFGSWYTDPIVDRVFGRIKERELLGEITSINHLERMLVDDGALILKFWFHLGKRRQKKRLEQLEADPDTRWRVTQRDWDFFKLYDRFTEVSEIALRETSTAWAPWTVVEGSDPHYRSVTVGRTILEAIRKRLGETSAPSPSPAPPLVEPVDKLRILDTLDLTQAVPKEKYEKKLEKLQGQIGRLTHHPRFARVSAVCVFEGMDAAGKGGAIRRLTSALDARLFTTVPVAAPTDEERAQPYLWRFWRHLPRKGHLTLYDRSWYGRVLVERVEKFCSEGDWMRAYSEINEFEEQLARNGTVVCKFWLQLDRQEQLRRFQEREQTRFKQFKITPEDWRNRDKWDLYQVAADDMIDRTSTRHAPWTLVEANDKYHARLKVLETFAEALEAALEG